MDEPLSASGIIGAVAALLLGLSAGLFFTYSNSVMPGLAGAGDREYATVMNSINRKILNPAFFIVFAGALLAPGAAAIVAFASSQPTRAWLEVAAAVVYLLGVLVVTGRVNVPLNNALAANGDRVAFEVRWVGFNHVRAASGILAFAIAIVALLV